MFVTKPIHCQFMNNKYQIDSMQYHHSMKLVLTKWSAIANSMQALLSLQYYNVKNKKLHLVKMDEFET